MVNSNTGGRNAHHTMKAEHAAVNAPAGTPASSAVKRIAGRKVAKYSGIPNRARTTRNPTAAARAATATNNADTDHGLSRSQYSGFATVSPQADAGIELLAY